MEKNVPAPNDIINTTLGGIVMGEMNNRIVKLVMRKISNKQKRNWDTDSLRVNTNPCSENLIASIATESGWRQIISNYNKTKITSRQGMYARVNLQYGDPFTACKVPFDNFSMVTEIGHSDTAKLNSIQIEGCIYGKIIHQTEIAKHVVSISMNYDYFQNDHFVYGAQSIEMNLLSRINFSKNVQLELHAGTGIIALAAVHNTHMYYGEGRNYDYCSGISLHVGARLNVFSKLYLNLNSNMQETITVNGYTGSHLLQNTAVDLRIVLGKGFSIVAATSSCVFNGYYKNYADVTERYVLRNVGVGYKIKI